MSDKPQDTPIASPPAASPSPATQSHQEDVEMLRAAVDDMHRHLVGLTDESQVEERKDDSSEPPLPLASRIADCCLMIQKMKAIKDQHLEGSSKSTTELVEKNERYILELQLLAKSLEKASPGYEAPKESDGLVAVFKAVRAHLKKSSTRESDMQEKICHLEGQCKIKEEVLARMKEHEKLFVQLRNVEQRLTNVMPGFVSTESNETPSIVSYIHEHIAERQEKQSSLSADLLIREEEMKKSEEALRSMKTKLDQAKQSTRRAEQDLEKCKAELEQAKLEVSSAKAAESSLADNLGKLLDRTKEALLRIEFPREVISMEIPDKVGWLAGEHERTCIEIIVAKQDLEQANSKIYEFSTNLKDAVSLIEFPKEIQPEQTSLDKVRWLACDYKRTCEELGATKLNLEWAKGELDKYTTDLKAPDSSRKIVDGLSETMRAPEDEANEEGSDTETSRTGLAENFNNPKDAETLPADNAGKVVDGAKKVISSSGLPQGVISIQDYNRTCEELGVAKFSLEQAKGELDKSSTDLEAAQLKAEGLQAIENVISLIEFPTEIHAEQSLDKISWLAGDYKRTCEKLAMTKLSLEQAKFELDMHAAGLKATELRAGRLLSKMKANLKGCMNIQDSSQKFVDKLSETIRNMEREVNEEDPSTGTSGKELAQQQPACDQTQRESSATASQSFYDGSNRGYPMYYSGNPADGAAQGYMQQQTQLQAPGSGIAPQPFHHNSSYAYLQPNMQWGVNPMSYGSPAQLQAPGSAIAPNAFPYGSGNAYLHPSMQWGVNSMSYGSQAQQFGDGYYDTSGVMQTYIASTSHQDPYDEHTEEDSTMSHLQPDHRRSTFSRGRPYERARGRRPQGRGA